MNWDIVFIHKAYGAADYKFDYSLETLLGALDSNPRARVFFVSHQPTESTDLQAHKGLVQLSISDYLRFATPFADKYVHFSPNGLEGERFCFERWFILKQLAEQFQISSCLYLDSDVLLLDDVSVNTEAFAKAHCSLGDVSSPHTNFIPDTKLVADFCQFCASAYDASDPKLRRKLLEIVADGPSPRTCCASISDMTFWRLFVEWHHLRFAELKQIRDGSIFDHNINIPQEGFELISDVTPVPPTLVDIKNLLIKDGAVHGRFLPTGQLVRFRSLHFQGPSKRWIGLIRELLVESWGKNPAVWLSECAERLG